jgi:hypothetical protein
MDLTNNIMPYMGCSNDGYIAFMVGDDKRTFRVFTYSAYNAHGLIGSEYNGIAIMDEDAHQVLCDNIARAASGYYGVTQEQADQLGDLREMSWHQFCEFINHNQRSRYTIDEETGLLEAL